MKKTILVAALAIGLICSSAKRFAASDDLYPKAATVTGFDIENDMVITTDAAGVQWLFGGIEDWDVGDTAAFIIDSCGTEEISDDLVISVRYSG